MINSTPQDFENLFPGDTHEKRVFTFSKEELSFLQTYDTIKVMGEMAGVLIDNMLNGLCLPRVGIPAKEGVGTIYDRANATFTVYVPKNWCDLCKEKAGTIIIEDKKYCGTCGELMKIRKQVEFAEKEKNGKS